MSTNAKLSLSLVVIFLADMCVLVGGYMHGHMHLIKTLQAAAQAWK